MPIKLIQVQRKLNVGINTAVDFLRQKGFSVEENPNTRISDEQYALLVKEFGQNLPKKTVLSKANETTEHTKGNASDEKKSPDEIKTVIPEEFKPKIVTKGKIDLNEKHPKKESINTNDSNVQIEDKEEDKTLNKKIETKIENDKENVSEDVKPEPEKKQEENISASASDNVFRLNPRIEPNINIKVTGKIDLSTINQSTRPKKKSKEEKRKERDERREKFSKTIASPLSKENRAKANDNGIRPGEEGENKKKRKRIKKDRVDINNVTGTNARPKKEELKKPKLKKRL